MNNNPYIEYKGQKYEFEADFVMKRDFDRERQNEVKKCLVRSGVTEKDYENFKEIQEFALENKEAGIEKLTEEQKSILVRMFDLLDTLSLIPLYEKYCHKMLERKYGMSKSQFQSILEGLAEDYGISFVDEVVQKVCEKVFTQMVEKVEKKPLPTWDWMN